eukprot:3553013-Rhodomonas_salina.2
MARFERQTTKSAESAAVAQAVFVCQVSTRALPLACHTRDTTSRLHAYVQVHGRMQSPTRRWTFCLSLATVACKHTERVCSLSVT